MFDLSYLIYMLPVIILTLYAQSNVSSTFNKYSAVRSRSGYTGAQVAKMLLNAAGIMDVSVEHVSGNLTDHYDPRNKVLRLSDAVYGSTSIAALGVAAHETGHAVQHNRGYVFLNIRDFIFPVVSFSSKLAGPIIMIGFILTMFSRNTSVLLLGIILFAAVVVFQVVTLPVEFNASSRAIDMLDENSILSSEEIQPARKVLKAAALTYIASAAASIATLLRYIYYFNRSRDN